MSLGWIAVIALTSFLGVPMVMLSGMFAGIFGSIGQLTLRRRILSLAPQGIMAAAIVAYIVWDKTLWEKFLYLFSLLVFVLWGFVLPWLVMQRWRARRLTHEAAALLLALLGGPGWLIVAMTLPVGLDPETRLGFLLAAAAGTAMSYPFARLILRWLGGEYDPPASKGYRRRP